MRRLCLLAAALLVIGCASADPTGAMLVLRGVTVIDGTGAAPVADMEVVIEGDRISAVRPMGRRPLSRQARILDLPGRFLIPGLIDTHAHVTILDFHREVDGTTRAEYRRDLSERALALLLAHGVTTVRNPSAPAVEGVALREDVARGTISGPRIVTSGEHLQNPQLSEETLRAEVRRQRDAGVDLIKVYAGLSAGQVGAVIEEAHAAGLPVVGHLQNTSWTEAARLGIDAITHGASWSRTYLPEERRPQYIENMLGRLDWLEWIDLDGPEISGMIRELAERRIPVDPTLVTYHTKFFGDHPRWTENPALDLFPELSAHWREGRTWVSDWTPEDFTRARSLWPKMEGLIRRYYENGVLISAGSDLPQEWTVPGVSLHEEMELLVAAGIPPLEVLTIATRNGAETLGLLAEDRHDRAGEAS